MESEILQIYKSFADDVFRFCMFKLNNREQAEDITSETFLKLAEQDISKIQNPKAWLITVSRNKMYDHFRKKRELLLDEEKSETIRDDSVLEHVVLNKMQVEEVIAEIRKLDDQTSDIIILRIWEELSF
ncbi:MAG: hypothetical protein Kow0081_3210 [Candidatus Dojkabacteria bacterium]